MADPTLKHSLLPQREADLDFVDLRSRLIEAAHNIIAIRGLSALTRPILAEAANVDLWMVSRTFATKEELVTATRQHSMI